MFGQRAQLIPMLLSATMLSTVVIPILIGIAFGIDTSTVYTPSGILDNVLFFT